MTDVVWTMRYDLKADNRHFKVFVSEQQGIGFHASCLWYEGGRALKAPGQPGGLTFHLEQRHAAAETEALAQLEVWIEEKFGKGYALTSEGTV